MGNKLTCCLKSNASPKLGQHSGWVNRDEESGVCVAGTRNSVAAPPAPTALEPAELTFQACVGRPVLYLGDLEMPKELVLELIPSDNPRASTIFLKKSQMDVREKKNYSYHVSPGHRSAKYSSCSTVFLDDSTVCHPNVRITMQCLALAIYYHIKNRDANRSEDIFDERLHPFTQEIVPEEYFNHNPDSESIYRFIHPFFSATKLTAEWAVIALVYLERLLIYAEIDICPTNWKRIILGAILLASKYLHDRALRNADFCQIFEGITVKDINDLERQYLHLLQFRLNVSASVYAKYYFDLRSLASDHGLPIVFAPLRTERAQNLEAISRYCENKNLCMVAIKKSSSSFSTLWFQSDPYCQLLENQYNSLHDPHLRAYHSCKDIQKRLKERGYTTSSNEKMLAKQVNKLQENNQLPGFSDAVQFQNCLLWEDTQSFKDQEQLIRPRVWISRKLEQCERRAEEQRHHLMDREERRQWEQTRRKLSLLRKIEKKQHLLEKKNGLSFTKKARKWLQKRRDGKNTSDYRGQREHSVHVTTLKVDVVL